MDRVDIKMDVNGEFLLNSAGDFDIVTNDDLIIQTIMFRLKTTKGDWLLSPNVGTEIETMIGQRNSNENLEKIKAMVTREISQINQMPIFTVYTAPQSTTGVWILVEFESLENPASNKALMFDFDLKTGQISARLD